MSSLLAQQHKARVSELKHELAVAQAQVHAHSCVLRKITRVERQEAQRQLEAQAAAASTAAAQAASAAHAREEELERQCEALRTQRDAAASELQALRTFVRVTEEHDPLSPTEPPKKSRLAPSASTPTVRSRPGSAVAAGRVPVAEPAPLRPQSAVASSLRKTVARASPAEPARTATGEGSGEAEARQLDLEQMATVLLNKCLVDIDRLVGSLKEVAGQVATGQPQGSADFAGTLGAWLVQLSRLHTRLISLRTSQLPTRQVAAHRPSPPPA